jgi:hypothetical protein
VIEELSVGALNNRNEIALRSRCRNDPNLSVGVGSTLFKKMGWIYENLVGFIPEGLYRRIDKNPLGFL